MREAGSPDFFVFGTNVNPLVNVDDGQFSIYVQDDLQPIRQRIFFKLDFGCVGLRKYWRE